jgi:hypothetical protein
MAAISSTTIALAGLAIGAAGTAVSVVGQQAQAAASATAEKARKMQMNLDASRRRRESIREAIIAKGLAVNTAEGQGAGEGTGLQGGLAQISGQRNRNIGDTNQNVTLGNKIFDANVASAQAGATVAFGQGAQQIGGTLMNNNVKLSQISGARFKT